jgi:hypothetical protein
LISTVKTREKFDCEEFRNFRTAKASNHCARPEFIIIESASVKVWRASLESDQGHYKQRQ